MLRRDFGESGGLGREMPVSVRVKVTKIIAAELQPVGVFQHEENVKKTML